MISILIKVGSSSGIPSIQANPALPSLKIQPHHEQKRLQTKETWSMQVSSNRKVAKHAAHRPSEQPSNLMYYPSPVLIHLLQASGPDLADFCATGLPRDFSAVSRSGVRGVGFFRVCRHAAGSPRTRRIDDFAFEPWFVAHENQSDPMEGWSMRPCGGLSFGGGLSHKYNISVELSERGKGWLALCIARATGSK
jgi:hypothetical protein